MTAANWSKCFDPRPCEGATERLGVDAGADVVSIRAPVRGRPDYVSGMAVSYVFRSAPL